MEGFFGKTLYKAASLLNQLWPESLPADQSITPLSPGKHEMQHLYTTLSQNVCNVLLHRFGVIRTWGIFFAVVRRSEEQSGQTGGRTQGERSGW
jgi:hypothetical protein